MDLARPRSGAPDYNYRSIGHFTVVCLVTWPTTASEAGGDLVLILSAILMLWLFRENILFL